jgi:hypothetical protein
LKPRYTDFTEHKTLPKLAGRLSYNTSIALRPQIPNKMTKHPKPPRDLNQWAERIVEIAAGAG